MYGHAIYLFSEDMREEEELLPEHWRILPSETRRAVESLVRGHVLDLVFETDDILETEAVQVDDPNDPISVERSSSSRSFVQYSPELETIRWSWSGYASLNLAPSPSPSPSTSPSRPQPQPRPLLLTLTLTRPHCDAPPPLRFGRFPQLPGILALTRSSTCA